MGYKDLIHFKLIFGREDFNFISDPKKIEGAGYIILNISNLYREESNRLILLETFLTNLTSFYESVVGNNIPDINNGYSIIFEELQKCMKLYHEPELNRRSISRGYCKKMNKIFLYGLSNLLNGIRAAFDPDIISSTNIDKAQFVRYVLDNVEGLGKDFLFNTRGQHAFVNKINNLNMQELIVTARLLSRPSRNQIRTFNGWRDLGVGHAPIRILSQRKRFRKDRVYFLYRTNEHNPYEAQLQTPPDRVAFSAA